MKIVLYDVFYFKPKFSIDVAVLKNLFIDGALLINFEEAQKRNWLKISKFLVKF